MSVQFPLPYSEEWWRVTLSSIGDAVIVTDATGRISFLNPIAEALTGWTSTEAQSKELSEVFSIVREGTRDILENPVGKVIQTGSVAELANRTVLLSRSGAEVFIDDSAAPIKDADGRIFGVVLVFRDVGAKKRAQNERAYLAAIVDSSDDAIVAKTLDGVVTSWNQAAERMFGYDASEAIGQKIYMLMPTERYAEETEILSRLRKGQRIEHYETVRRKKDGTLIDVSLTVSPIKDAEGQIVGASKIARDITEKKQAERDLRESHEALEIINRVGRLLASEFALQKIVQTLTDAATSVTGAAFGSFFYNVTDEHGASFVLYALSGASKDLFAESAMPRAVDLFSPAFRDDGIVRIDDVNQDPRYGENSPYYRMPEEHLPVTSYLAVPVMSRSGEVLGGLFFGHPKRAMFSKRHENIVVALAGQASSAMDNARLYEAMRKARADAETANRLKDEFLATVSHELRTPLNAILGWARLMRMGRLDEEGKNRAIETIERSAVSQGKIIEDILDVSRIITGKIRLDLSHVEIGQLVSETVESLRPAAEVGALTIQTALDAQPNVVSGDAQRLQQIVWNLLSNAVKFTPKGGRIQVTLSRVGSHVEISISDTGQGINPEFLPHVFERFRQADNSTKRTYGGLGLGLAIVRQLTELHGGNVRANSDGDGMGATFIVRLPLAPLAEGRRRSERRLLPYPRAVEGAMTARQELIGVRVLVVDDETDARELLRIVLEKGGAEVRVAGSAPQAFETLKDWKPDVLVSDIAMPQEDGYGLIRQVRGLPHKEGGSIPAAALTAYATAEDRLKALVAGFQTHIPKPVEPMELLAVVAVLAGKTGTASDKQLG